MPEEATGEVEKVIDLYRQKSFSELYELEKGNESRPIHRFGHRLSPITVEKIKKSKSDDVGDL